MAKLKQKQINILYNKKLRYLKAIRKTAKEINFKSKSKSSKKKVANIKKQKDLEEDKKKRGQR